MLDRVRELIDRHQPRLVVVTCGANGAVAVSPDDAVYEPGFVVELVDPIGSGDAFTAGFAHRYLDGAPPAECCRYGNAVGALVAGQSGATQPLTADDVEAFLDSDHPRSVDEDLASEAG
jgi:sugar/nucleoside kinase (ribokinase family)